MNYKRFARESGVITMIYVAFNYLQMKFNSWLVHPEDHHYELT